MKLQVQEKLSKIYLKKQNIIIEGKRNRTLNYKPK